MPRALSLTALPGIPLLGAGDDLPALLAEALARIGPAPHEHDVLVVAQKVVSKAEDRFVDLAAVTPSARAVRLAARVGKDPRLVELVLAESAEVLACRPGVLIVAHRRGFVIANAGIDHSNVGGTAQRVLLLPQDPDASAARLRAALDSRFGLRPAVVINDSTGRAWRHGTAGVALGAAGLPALLDLRGQPDLYGHALEVTQVGFADEIAAAASLLMGQGDEATPAVLVRGLHWSARARPAAALLRPPGEDLFRHGAGAGADHP